MAHLSGAAQNDPLSPIVLHQLTRIFSPSSGEGGGDAGRGRVWDYENSRLQGGVVGMQTSCQIFLHLSHQAISPLGVYSRELFCLSEVPALLRGKKNMPSPSAENWLNTLYYSYTAESYCSHQERMVCFFMYCHRETIEIYY